MFLPLFGQKGGNTMHKNNVSRDKNAIAKIEQLLKTAKEEPNSAKSIEFYESAIDLADSVGDEILKAQALYRSALLWKKRGEFIKTIDRLNSAIAIFKKNGNQKHEYLLLIDQIGRASCRERV